MQITQLQNYAIEQNLCSFQSWEYSLSISYFMLYFKNDLLIIILLRVRFWFRIKQQILIYDQRVQTEVIKGECSLGESEYDGASTGCKQVGQKLSQQQFTSSHADPSSFGPWMQFNRSMVGCNGINIIQLTILHQSTFKHNVLPENSKLLLIETSIFVFCCALLS